MRLFFILLAVVVAACARDAASDVADNQEVVGVLRLTSPSFQHNEVIPAKFTCEGDDVNPEFRIDGVPSSAKSLVLIMDDPDAPARVWEHWTVINIPPATTAIAEDSVPTGATQLTNDFRKVEWGGPCPPPGKVHRYQFKLYALDTVLNLGPSSRKADVEKAMKGHVIEEAVLVGTYKR